MPQQLTAGCASRSPIAVPAPATRIGSCVAAEGLSPYVASWFRYSHRRLARLPPLPPRGNEGDTSLLAVRTAQAARGRRTPADTGCAGNQSLTVARTSADACHSRKATSHLSEPRLQPPNNIACRSASSGRRHAPTNGRNAAVHGCHRGADRFICQHSAEGTVTSPSPVRQAARL